MTVPVAREFATVLQTPRLVLRPLGERDVSLVCAALRRNAARLGRSGDETLTRTATWIAAECAANECGERLSLLILARGAVRTELWGHVSLSDLQRGPDRMATLGFWVDASAEGRGIAYEALTRVVELAFDTMALERLEADVLPSNSRSRRLLERLQFTASGTHGDHLRYIRANS